MRKTFRSSAVLLSLALVGGIASTLAFAGSIATYAQEPQGPPPGQGEHAGPGGPRHHGPNAEFETRMLTKRLSLSADQAAKVEPILAAQDEQLKALRPQPGTQPGTQPDFKAEREQRKTIMDQTKTQLAGVLSAEQMAEFDKMHQHRGPGGPGGPGGQHGNWQGKPSSGN